MNAAVLLRQKVLDLAIRGKLTKRDEGDEPASALLARIVAERQKRDAASCRVRVRGALPPVSEDEKRFELPEGWEWCRLGDIGEIVLGKMLNRNVQVGNESEYLCTINVKWGNFDLSHKKRMRFNEDELKFYDLRKGDLLVCEGGDVGRCAVWQSDESYPFQNSLHRIRMFEVMPEYIQMYIHWLGVTGELQRMCSGVTIKHFTISIVSRLPIPLPPLAEQKRIVERIDKLLAAIDQYLSAMGKISDAADMLEKKVLDLAIRGKLSKQEKSDGSASEIIEEIAADKAKRIAKKQMRKEKTLPPIMPEDEPFELPKDWIWCRFGELCAYGQCEAVSFSGLPKNTWALDLEEIEKDTGRLIERKLVKDKQATSGKHLFKKGMLLYSKLRTYLNKVLIADQDGVCTSEIIPIDFHGFVDAAYARIVLMSPYFLSYTASKDYGVKMPRVSTDDMRMAAFPLPPLAEQKRIVERVDAILAECRKVSR